MVMLYLVRVRMRAAAPAGIVFCLNRLRMGWSVNDVALLRCQRGRQYTRQFRQESDRVFGHRRFRCEQRLGFAARLRFVLAIIRGAGGGVIPTINRSAFREIFDHIFCTS